MTSPKDIFFRHATGEEPFTDFFVSLLARGDTAGILNAIHSKDRVEFDDSARVVATQREGLGKYHPENNQKRVLDWVVKDKTKLVGYEVKRGDPIDPVQLQEEVRKLNCNADHRDVKLFVITDDIKSPQGLPDLAHWMSWSNAGKSLDHSEKKSVIIELINDLFEYMSYKGFTGFTQRDEAKSDEQWFVKRQNEAAEFAIEIGGRSDQVTLYHKKRNDIHNRVTDRIERVRNHNSRGFSPVYYVFPYHPIHYESIDTDYNISEKGYYIAIVIPALQSKVWVHMNLYASKYDTLRQDLVEQFDLLLEIGAKENMCVLTSTNSQFSQATFNEFNLDDQSDREELKENFINYAGEGEWKRLRFGWTLPDNIPSEELLTRTNDKIERLHDIFYLETKRRRDFNTLL